MRDLDADRSLVDEQEALDLQAQRARRAKRLAEVEAAAAATAQAIANANVGIGEPSEMTTDCLTQSPQQHQRDKVAKDEANAPAGVDGHAQKNTPHRDRPTDTEGVLALTVPTAQSIRLLEDDDATEAMYEEVFAHDPAAKEALLRMSAHTRKLRALNSALEARVQRSASGDEGSADRLLENPTVNRRQHHATLPPWRDRSQPQHQQALGLGNQSHGQPNLYPRSIGTSDNVGSSPFSATWRSSQPRGNALPPWRRNQRGNERSPSTRVRPWSDPSSPFVQPVDGHRPSPIMSPDERRRFNAAVPSDIDDAFRSAVHEMNSTLDLLD